MAKPPLHATLTWDGDLRFTARAGTQTLVVDSDSAAGPSPVQLLAIALAGCMSIDIADIVRKGRHALDGLETAFEGERAQTPPHKFTAITLRFTLRGDVPPAAVERAIALSRDRYCSVWHSMHPEIALATSFEVVP